jgi:Tol biopolymer transport system component
MWHRFLYLVIGLFFVTACSSTTPTRSVLPTTTPTLAPTLVSPPTLVPAVATPTEFPTKVAFAVTPTREPPRATSTPTASPKPSAPTGRLAYTLVTGREPRFFTIWVANANGTNPRQILTHALWPTFSPDGKQIAFFGRPEGKPEGLYIAFADGGSVTGPHIIGPGVCCMDWSSDGQWIVYTNSPRPNRPGGPIAMVKMDGTFKTIVPLGVDGNGPAFSSDGKQIVYSGCLPNTNTCGLMIVPTSGGAPRMVTTDNGGNADWSPRGDKIVYQASDSAGHTQVFVVNPDGSGKRQLTRGTSNDGQPVWSRDGSAIFWRSDQNGTAWAIYVMNADGSAQRKLIDSVPPHPDLWGWESLSVAP